jgi:hypothetical protein
MVKRILVLVLLLACSNSSMSAGGWFFGHRRFATRSNGFYHAPAPASVRSAPQSVLIPPHSVHMDIQEQLRSQTMGGFKIDDMLDPYLRARNTDFR